MGLLYLLTLYATILAATGSHPVVWTIASIAACLLALGCKEVAVSAPIVVLFYDRAFLAGSFREAWRRRWPLYCGLMATWLIFLPFSIAHSGRGFTGSMTGHTRLEYARSQPGVILHYLRLCVWPQGQCLDYRWPVAQTAGANDTASDVDRGVIGRNNLAHRSTTPTGILGGLVLLDSGSHLQHHADSRSGLRAPHVFAPRRRSRRLGHHCLRTGVPLACESTRIHSGRSRPRAGLRPGATYVPANRAYSRVLAAWEDVAAKAPWNARAPIGIGIELAQSGHHAAALAHFEAAGRLKPDYVDVADFQNNWAACLVQLNRGDEAIPHFLMAQKEKPDDYSIHLNLAVLLASARPEASGIVRVSRRR